MEILREGILDVQITINMRKRAQNIMQGSGGASSRGAGEAASRDRLTSRRRDVAVVSHLV